MTDPRETYTAAALDFARVALGPNGVRCAVTTDEYRVAFEKLKAAAPTPATIAPKEEFLGVLGLVPAAVADGPALSDREVEMHLKHFATADFAGGLVARELWERVKMLVAVDYAIGGSGKITARIGATPDGATRVTREFK